MSETLLHEPKLVTDDDLEVTFLECAICGKVLWYPGQPCPGNPNPPALGINVTEGIGTKDIFGG